MKPEEIGIDACESHRPARIADRGRNLPSRPEASSTAGLHDSSNCARNSKAKFGDVPDGGDRQLVAANGFSMTAGLPKTSSRSVQTASRERVREELRDAECDEIVDRTSRRKQATGPRFRTR